MNTNIDSFIEEREATQANDNDNYTTQLKRDPSNNVDELCLTPDPSSGIFFPITPHESIDETSEPIDTISSIQRKRLDASNTNEKPEENSKRNQTLKLKNDNELIMISYNRRSAGDLCKKIVEQLRKLGYHVWMDEDDASGDIQEAVAIAIQNSFVVLLALNEEYSQSYWCKTEAQYAFQCKKICIPMIMQSNYKPTGWLSFNIASRRRIDFSKPEFQQSFDLLVREIEGVRKSLKKNPITNLTMTESITTMTNCSAYPRDVQKWNTNDVIQWLKREQLEVFQDSLTSFTGETLWQLYKIKFTSPSDYYRIIETLLTPKISSRLFYILKFITALESLFSSSNNIFMTDTFFIIFFLSIIVLLPIFLQLF